MALISCPECEQQVSDQAAVCIHCGYPLMPKPTKHGLGARTARKPKRPAQQPWFETPIRFRGVDGRIVIDGSIASAYKIGWAGEKLTSWDVSEIADIEAVPDGYAGLLRITPRTGSPLQIKFSGANRKAAEEFVREFGLHHNPPHRQVEVRVKEYANVKEFERDAEVMLQAGWRIDQQTPIGSHINVGRTAFPAFMTGGLSLLLGASRSNGAITVTWVRDH
jgi:hypothetical protein